jgi:hypothetical protein
VANIELEAYGRAKKIEDSAIQNTSMAKSALTGLFQDAKRRFDLTKDDASRTVLRISQELDRLKEVLKHLPGSFDAISSEIDALKFGNDKKNDASAEEQEKEVSAASEALGDMQYEAIVYPESAVPESGPIFEIISDTDREDAAFVADASEDAAQAAYSVNSDDSGNSDDSDNADNTSFRFEPSVIAKETEEKW